MGKHSNKQGGLFGRSPKGLGSRKPVRRRVPRPIASGAELAALKTGAGALSKERVSDPKERTYGPLESAPARLRAERERRHRRLKRIASIVMVSLVGALIIAAAGLFAYAKHLERTMQRTVYQKETLDLDLVKAEPQKPFNVLLLGFDKRPKDTTFRSDTVILGRVDPVSKQVWLLSIPRDTRVEIPGYGTRKINEAYALGGEKLAVKTVERFTGLPIHHYMGINFKGFHKAVDAMGGVWIDVPVRIDDPEADATKGDRASKIDPGYQLLDGAHALTFVRTRHGLADQDFGRMRNQQAFFLAVADQIANRTPVSRLPRIVAAMAPYISTDMSLVEMVRTAHALQKAGSKRVYTETISGQWRSPFVITDEALKKELLAKLKEGVPFKDPESSAEASTTGVTPKVDLPALKPSDITVTVRNGAGIAGCAKQASSVLKARAFEVAEVGNAAQFVYDKTIVVHKNNPEAAQLVASVLPPGVKLVESRGMYRFDTDILVVVGKDWDIARVPVTPIKTD